MKSVAEEARESVLGCLLYYYTPQLVHIVQAQGVQWDDFYTDRERLVYRAVLRLHADGLNVDRLTVEAFLDRHGCLDRAGGRAYLDFLALPVGVSCLREHAQVVAEDGRWRRWTRAFHEGWDALSRRDLEGFWVAVGRIRGDVEPEPRLRVVKDGRAA